MYMHNCFLEFASCFSTGLEQSAGCRILSQIGSEKSCSKVYGVPPQLHDPHPIKLLLQNILIKHRHGTPPFNGKRSSCRGVHQTWHVRIGAGALGAISS